MLSLNSFFLIQYKNKYFNLMKIQIIIQHAVLQCLIKYFKKYLRKKLYNKKKLHIFDQMVKPNSLIKINLEMLEKEILNTEEKILEAAKEIFVNEGSAGARMQEIADKAGINKSLLHYYFRSKEKLFEKVFSITFSKLIKKILNIFESDEDFFVKLEKFIENYLDILFKNRFIPMFIISELNKKGNNIAVTILKSSNIDFSIFVNIVQKEIRDGKIKDIDARNLFINILSLCIFPIVARPLIEEIIFEGKKNNYEIFLAQRKDEIFNIIKSTIIKI
jgi:AcrR family transcriptional regulator